MNKITNVFWFTTMKGTIKQIKEELDVSISLHRNLIGSMDSDDRVDNSLKLAYSLSSLFEAYNTLTLLEETMED